MFSSNKALVKLLTIPNLLTIGRIFVAPLFLFFITTIPQRISMFRWLSALLFGVVAITDLLDGYLARRNKQVSDFGKCFDHIADKVVVILVLVGLVYARKANVICVGIILLRELTISGLREFLGTTYNEKIPVISAGKVKTAFQMAAVFVLLIAERGSQVMDLGNTLLYVATTFTVFTMYGYIEPAIKKLNGQ